MENSSLDARGWVIKNQLVKLVPNGPNGTYLPIKIFE